MARPERKDADYFPFYAKDGRTLFILENKYQCKGTGFFTNVMRFLTLQSDHHFCIKDKSDELYFFAKTFCDIESGMDMLNIMANTGKIFKPLWVSYQVIVSPDLLHSLLGAYVNRKNAICTIEGIQQKYITYPINPQEPVVSYPENPQEPVVSYPENPQTKLKETKLKEIKDIYMFKFNEFWKAYPKKRGKGKARDVFLKLKPNEELFNRMIKAIKIAKQNPDWNKNGGQYIPLPATWLNQERWEDEYAPTSKDIPKNLQGIYDLAKRWKEEGKLESDNIEQKNVFESNDIIDVSN